MGLVLNPSTSAQANKVKFEFICRGWESPFEATRRPFKLFFEPLNYLGDQKNLPRVSFPDGQWEYVAVLDKGLHVFMHDNKFSITSEAKELYFVRAIFPATQKTNSKSQIKSSEQSSDPSNKILESLNALAPVDDTIHRPVKIEITSGPLEHHIGGFDWWERTECF